ncbi:MAG: ribonuclease HII [Candidatus Binataceae bacterium]
MSKRPDLRYERKLWRAGHQAVAGIDEAGVGPMAGPVVAAAVIFAPEYFIAGVHDSKQLRSDQRTRLDCEIRAGALALAVGVAEPAEIDRLNIYWATMLAMRRALDALAWQPDHVLVDGRTVPELTLPQTRIVGGDRKSFCIAAASIVAKVTRDAIMLELDARYPEYGFARHKGYCTEDHLHALRRHGPSPIHRQSFAPVARWRQLELLV